MSSLVRWKIAVALLVLCCLLLVYRIVDQGITSTYLNASSEASAVHMQLLKNLIEREWRGLPEDQVVIRLQEFVDSRPHNSVVLKRVPEEKNVIYVDGIGFEFQTGKFLKVRE